jgi:UDP-glucose 4-epimerase
VSIGIKTSISPLRSLGYLSGRRVLVTGASGFIGSHLCRRLYGEGVEIHAMSRQRYGSEKGGYRWWQGDLAQIETARNLIRDVKPEVIFHLAGCVDGARHLSMVVPTFLSNLAATVNLLTVAAEAGCQRLILAGSQEEPVADDAQATPCSPYAVAKWAGSAYARMFRSLYRLPVTVLRTFMVYGPAQRDERKLIPYVILSLLRGEVPKLTAGSRPVDWVYIDDVVEAFAAAALAPDIEGHTVDVGSGELVTIRSVVERIADYIQPKVAPHFGALPDRALEQVRAANIVRTETVLGWNPTVSLAEGLIRTIDWYKQRAQLVGPKPVERQSITSSDPSFPAPVASFINRPDIAMVDRLAEGSGSAPNSTTGGLQHDRH